MSHALDSDQAGKRPRRWFQFGLRTALWAIVTLGVAFGWLSDRLKLKQQLSQERAEKEGLRAARDYAGQQADYNLSGVTDYWGNSGWHYPLVPTGEADEATVEHLKDYLADEPIYAGVGGPAGGNPLWLGSTAIVGRGDSIFLGGSSTLPISNFDIFAPSLLAGGPAAKLVRDVPAKDPGSVAALVKLLEDGDATRRARAACTLARLGPNAKDAVPALIGHLKDADATVRFHAAYALGRIRDSSSAVIAALREAMNDDNSTVSPFAAQVLHRLDPTIDTVPRLIELLDHREAATRRRAAAALAVVGSQATPGGAAVATDLTQAIPKLKKLCTDPDTETSKQAMIAITRLTSPTDAHAILGEVVRAGPAADQEAWTFAALLWNKLDRVVRATKVNSP